MNAPVIHGNSLVSGNTRLMLAQLRKKNPKVYQI